MKTKPVTVVGSPQKTKQLLSKLTDKKVNKKVVLKPSIKYLTQRLGMSSAAAHKLLGG